MSELSNAIRSVCEEKGLKYEDIIVAIEFSLAAAYRKDYGNKNQNIKVKFNPETGESEIEDVKTVVEDLPEDFFEKEEERRQNNSEEQASKKTDEKDNIDKNNENNKEIEEERKFYPKTEIQLSDALLIQKNVKVGDEIRMELEEPESYGRMASQTAKQVIIQKIREMEREMIYQDFKEKEHEVVNGIVQRFERRNVLIDLGKAIGIMPYEEQIPNERYNSGDRIKVYIKSVTLETKGPRIVLSRISEEIVKALFYMEIPELSSGVIELKAIARIAGSRLKVAVSAEVDNIDPIGSCVGQKGARIQTIISELNGEKVDIIEYDDDISKFVSNALLPAKVISVEVNKNEKSAVAIVSKDQFSLAIGRRGENIRLASVLTGLEIKIKEEGVDDEKVDNEEEVKNIEKKVKDDEKEGDIKKEKVNIKKKENNNTEDDKEGKKEVKIKK